MNSKTTIISAVALSGALLAGPAMSDTFLSDVPGSFLVYPVFDLTTNQLSDSVQQNSTQIRISNLASGEKDNVYVKFVTICGKQKTPDAVGQGGSEYDPGTPDSQEYACPALDIVHKLTPKETKVLTVGGPDLPVACSEGFIVAYAVSNDFDRTPVVWDELIGSYLITTTSPRRGMADQAIAIQTAGESSLNSIDLDFNGVEYENMADELYTDFRAITFNPNLFTDLVLLSLDIDAGAQNYPTDVSIKFYNRAEKQYSTRWEFFCWDRVRLDRMSPSFRASNFGGHEVNADGEYVGDGDYGHLTVDPRYNTVLGTILELGGDYNSARNLYHDDIATTTTFYEN